MEKWTRLSAEQRDNLTAYLDGELEDNLTQQIDHVLAKSEVARHEVEALARTWELLDLLPKPSARDDFTERTLTTLKVSEVRPRLVDQPWFGYVRRGSIGAAWVLGLAACALAGFFITSRAIPGPQDELLTNLPLVKDLDLYLEVPDLHFVTELQKSTVFNISETETADAPIRRLDVSTSHAATPAVLRERTEEIKQAPESERQRLLHNWATFQALPEHERDRIRNLHEELLAEPETKHALLETYRMWLQTLTPGQQDDLRQAKSTGVRLQLIRDFKDKQDANRETRLFDLNLDLRRMKPRMPSTPYFAPEDLAAVMDIMQSALPPSQQKDIVDKNPIVTGRYLEIFRNYSWNSPRQLTDAQIDQILDAIGDETHKDELSEISPTEQRRRAVMMYTARGLHAEVLKQLEPVYPGEKELRDFFATLNGDRRHELMSPKDEEDAKDPFYLTRELMKDYLKKLETEKPDLAPLLKHAALMQGISRPPDSWGGFRRGGRGGPGPRPDRSRPDDPSPENRPGPGPNF